jgi:hypothetical protein
MDLAGAAKGQCPQEFPKRALGCDFHVISQPSTARRASFTQRALRDSGEGRIVEKTAGE